MANGGGYYLHPLLLLIDFFPRIHLVYINLNTIFPRIFSSFFSLHIYSLLYIPALSLFYLPAALRIEGKWYVHFFSPLTIIILLCIATSFTAFSLLNCNCSSLHSIYLCSGNLVVVVAVAGNLLCPTTGATTTRQPIFSAFLLLAGVDV